MSEDRFKTPLLEGKHLTRRDQATSAALLNDVTLGLSPGERMSVVGPSGAGKSLLLRSLAYLDPFDGKLSWLGQDVTEIDIPAFRTKVVYMHQRPALGEGTVKDSLAQVFTFKANRQKAFKTELAMSLLREINLGEDFLAKRLANLSGGEAQIVALMRAIQLQPRVLLLDEPTSALDPARTATVEALVQRWYLSSRAEHAYIWVTHSPEQALRIANRHVRMNGGHLLPE